MSVGVVVVLTVYCLVNEIRFSIPAAIFVTRQMYRSLIQMNCIWSGDINTLKAELNPHLPFAGIIRSSPYSPR